MINEAALLESKTLRDSVLERTEVLDRVKALSLLPDGMHVTTAMVATYFSVTVEAVRQLVKRHREELEVNGLIVLRGADLRKFESDNMSLSLGSYPQARRSLTIYSRRAVLNIAMLLRDSDVARQVRTYLLDVEYLARTRPVDTTASGTPHALDARIDQRITHILGKTVVPMFNALIEASGEHRQELISLREDVQQIEQRLCDHDTRITDLERTRGPRPYTGIMASIDAMNWREFEHHVAVLLRRDGCTDVIVHGGPGDRGVDVTAHTADGRSVVAQCKSFAPYRPVWSGELQKFLGASHVQHTADVALFVATTSFTPDARAIAETYGVTLVDRAHLEKWSAGVPLSALQ
ncbi:MULTISPECIES: restriction endonuclease [unclassified Streptomyces]|uniref:restriction endonuclease n=1 Tax=unclassified Streptomyces TaxID=2593676 RepID=UPI002251EC13|nr:MULTISPECIES: restriction endonuclease [unclassified Streptomyces]MCX4408581.1 restriction endonuclease [Streptomyces sp. NBC_01764]MCX5185826.1 restriction endonuclease [Streptomyces sp. NBC_00268]